jgi:hypothetical protein
MVKNTCQILGLGFKKKINLNLSYVLYVYLNKQFIEQKK